MAERYFEPTPTFVLDRRVPRADRPPRDTSVVELGLHRIGEELLDAPGAWLSIGHAKDGQRVLIQMLRLKEATDDAAASERQQFERFLANETTALMESGAAQILSHGATDGARGERVLFWVVPWIDQIDAGDYSERFPRTWQELAAIGVSLAKVIAERHEQGWFSPHLTEESLVFSASRSSAVAAGVPLPIWSDWLAPGMTTSRLAPEEQSDGKPTKQGDLWRLGCALKVLSVSVPGEQPGELVSLLRALTEPDPRRRLRRASDVLAELEAVLALESDIQIEAPIEAAVQAAVSAPEEDATIRKVIMVSSSTSAAPVSPKTPARAVDYAVDENGWFVSTEAAGKAVKQTITPIPRISVAPKKARRVGPKFWIASSALGIFAGAVASIISKFI